MQTRVDIIEKVKYIANDGTEFDKEEDCIRHDAELKMKELRAEGSISYTQLNLLETGEFIQNDILDCILTDYFRIPTATGYGSYFCFNIKNENDLLFINAFCEYHSKEKVDRGFKIGEKYVIYIQTTPTKMFGNIEYLYVTEYSLLVAHYEVVLKKVKDIFQTS